MRELLPLLQENWRSAELLEPNDGTKLDPLPEHLPKQLITLERLLLLLLLRAPLRKAELLEETGVKLLLDREDADDEKTSDGREDRLGRLGQPKTTMLGPFEGSQEPPLNSPLAMQAPSFLLVLGLDEHL